MIERTPNGRHRERVDSRGVEITNIRPARRAGGSENLTKNSPFKGWNAMAENIAAKTGLEKGAAQIKETADKFSAVAEQTSKLAEDSFASAAKGLKDYNVKTIEFAQMNFEAAGDYTKQLMSAKSPSEMVELWTSYVRKQFQAMTEQSKEFAMLSQRMASEAAEPLSRQIH
jgi:phasin